MANGLPGLPPGIGLPPPGGGLPTVGGPPGPPPGMPDLGGLVSAMSLLTQERESGVDMVRRAIGILEDARENDPKAGKVISAAIHILRNGPEGLDAFQAFQTNPKKGSTGTEF